MQLVVLSLLRLTPFAIEQATNEPEKTVIGKGNRSTTIAERRFAPGPPMTVNTPHR